MPIADPGVQSGHEHRDHEISLAARRLPALRGSEELPDYARVIEARRSGVYRVSEAERATLAQSIAEADTGAFVFEIELAAFRKSHSR